MTSADERRASAEIARNLRSISEELSETNRLLAEFLRFQLHHEGDDFKQKESAKNDI
jgi:hypothetical protein